MVSCNQTQKDFIEVGLSNNHSSMVSSLWDTFSIGLKAKTQKESTQDIEVFYGHGLGDLFFASNDIYVVDWNQTLEFKLTRFIYFRDDDGIYNIVEKFEDILVINNTLKYFLGEEFDFKNNNSIIDTIEVNDLVQGNGLIYYEFVITTLENEPIHLYKYTGGNLENEPSKILDDKITSRHCVIEYTIDNQNQITFLEREEIRKDNVNVLVIC